MQSSNIPSKIPLPFAYAGTKNTIPVNSQIGIVDGKASLTDGFPPLTFTPLSAGGKPPSGADFNGILNEITAIQQWQSAGGFFTYDAGFSTLINGYPKGAVVQSTFGGLWISTSENNTTDPDSLSSNGWVPFIFKGSEPVSVTTSNVTLTQLQAAYPIITVSGVKTGARNLIFPNIVGQWIVQNNSTGSFSLTAKTTSGTGVTLTQGESTYIYSDGNNVYFGDSAKVASFNNRVGAITLNANDVITALGYTPLQSIKGLGYGGETWKNLTDYRGFNILYTNPYPYPIAVGASTTCSTGSSIDAYVNGVQVSYFRWQFNGCGSYGGAFIIVPPYQSYYLGSGQGVLNWTELY